MVVSGVHHRFNPRQLFAAQRLRSAPLTTVEVAEMDARLAVCPNRPEYDITPDLLRAALQASALTLREQHSWWMHTTPRVDEKPTDYHYPRLLQGLTAVAQSALPSTLHFPLLDGLATCGNSCLTAFGVLDKGLATMALFGEVLTPTHQVAVLIASATAMSTRVSQMWGQGWLQSSLCAAIPALQAQGLSDDFLAEALVSLIQHAGLTMSGDCTLPTASPMLVDHLTAFTNRGWNRAQAMQAWRLILERSGDYMAWTRRHLHPTLNILHATGCSPAQQLLIFEQIAKIEADAGASIADSAGGMFELRAYAFDAEVIAKLWLVTTAVEAELTARDDARLRAREARRQAGDSFVNFAEDLEAGLENMFEFPDGKDRFALCLNFIARTGESLRVAVELIIGLHEGEVDLLRAYQLTVRLLPQLTPRERHAFTKFLAQRAALIAPYIDELEALFHNFSAAKSATLQSIMDRLRQEANVGHLLTTDLPAPAPRHSRSRRQLRARPDR